MRRLPDYEPKVRVAQYDVSIVPLDDEYAGEYTLRVEQRFIGDLWSVIDYQGNCMDQQGRFERAPVGSSNHYTEWVDRHRFATHTAISLAKEFARKVRVNGTTAEEYLRSKGTPPTRRTPGFDGPGRPGR